MSDTPRIYLCYAKEDRQLAERVYELLADAGFRPWIDFRDVPAGAKWQEYTRKAQGEADLFLPLISSSWSSISFGQEIRNALARARRRGEGIYLIPVILDQPGQLRIPSDLREYRGVELYQAGGETDLIRAVNQAVAPGPVPAPAPPRALARACAAGECVLYVGAGLSAPMGLPMWGGLVRELLAWAEEERLVQHPMLASLTQSLESDTDLVADHVYDAARAAERLEGLVETLRRLFLNRDATPGPNHDLLRRVGFAAVLTTNFDNLLEQTFKNAPVYIPRETEPLLDALSRREFYLLKLYGTLNRPESVLIAPRQYEDEIAGNPAVSQFMESLFVSRTLLFVGASLAGIEEYLRGIRFRGVLSRRHYALVAVTGSAWRAKAEALRRRYQIEVLPYELSADHKEVEDFLVALLAGVQNRPEAAATAGGRRERSWLSRLRLENVGPFRDLDLTLDRNWNVLLGNNGVGKSSVLRAVAAALCGREAQLYADRLVRYDGTAGKVILGTSNEDGVKAEYVTELSRTGTGTEVKSLPGRVLEAEGWLAVGFPALRTVSWRRANGPQLEEGRRRPIADDVLPLITGDPDPRVDSLKQWLVNLDYRIKDQSNPRRDRYQELLSEFFQVIGRLTGGLRVQFRRVDLDRGRVVLETDDGEVPLEAVSQGTVSLLGWVGVLMQRLYEVYDDQPKPLEQYALVLMDEIDAHMHPEWQQELVPALSKEFPNTQFLVTTHSPLIVGGMDVKHVFRFGRDGATATRIALEPDAMMGRADQVLTGGGFGLITTVDKKTREEIDRYRELLGKRDLTPDEQAQLDRLRQTLAFRLPGPQEGQVERRASELLKALLWSQVADHHPEAQEGLLKKAEQLFTALRGQEGSGS
ncbi:MAG TPA: AAA family ATPase [Urbifossiella sp.]|jgi:hypothetical protein|nr:AAA family ATPase [Urbifossiella sp.]